MTLAGIHLSFGRAVIGVSMLKFGVSELYSEMGDCGIYTYSRWWAVIGWKSNAIEILGA